MIVAEAIANGIPVVVPANTPLSALLSEFGEPGTSFLGFDAGSIWTAIQRVLLNFDEFAARAHGAAVLWSKRHGSHYTVDAILALVDDAARAAGY